jgi:hypothetical protein
MRNLQEQFKKAFCYQRIFWSFTVWINYFSDLKNFANSQPSVSNFKSFSWSLEHFFSQWVKTILVTKYQNPKHKTSHVYTCFIIHKGRSYCGSFFSSDCPIVSKIDHLKVVYCSLLLSYCQRIASRASKGISWNRKVIQSSFECGIFRVIWPSVGSSCPICPRQAFKKITSVI